MASLKGFDPSRNHLISGAWNHSAAQLLGYLLHGSTVRICRHYARCPCNHFAPCKPACIPEKKIQDDTNNQLSQLTCEDFKEIQRTCRFITSKHLVDSHSGRRWGTASDAPETETREQKPHSRIVIDIIDPLSNCWGEAGGEDFLYKMDLALFDHL